MAWWTPGAAGAFYREWIVANGVAEAAGLGSTLVLGRAAAPLLSERPSALGLIAGAVGAILAGVVLEGLVVGWAQGRVLRRYLPALPLAAWVRATALGAGAAWVIGMIPSTVIGLSQLARSAGAAPPDSASEPTPMLQYGMALLLGAVTGPILGAVQSRALSQLRPPVRGWILANAVAWAVGMLLLFVAMDRLPWTRGSIPLILGIYAVCGAVGLAVGAVHGRWLLRRIGDQSAGVQPDRRPS